MTEDTAQPPLPCASTELIMKDGAVIRLRRYGNPRGARLVLSHGNGLAIDAYSPFWLPLTAQCDVIVFDIRNHGQNPLHEPERHRWSSIFHDFEEIFQGIQRWCGTAPTVGVFHSLSAIAAIEHTLAYHPRWAALVLFEPPIPPRNNHRLSSSDLWSSMEHQQRAERRQQRFTSPEEFAAQLRRRRAFAGWLPASAMLVAKHTLRQTGTGCWELRNPRELEARIYASKPDFELWQRMKQLSAPTILIGGDPRSPHASPSAAICEAIHQENGLDYTFIPQTTHFLQIEKPQACRDAMMAFLQRHDLLPQ